MKKENEDVKSSNKENNDSNIEGSKKSEKKELGLYSIKKVFEKEIIEGNTKFIHRAIRSGNKIMYNGSIVIIGDVNAGAEIIASENIIVLGELRGVAHAGAEGNKKAIVAAESIESPQLRIANILWENENNEQQKRYAYVESEEIKVIE